MRELVKLRKRLSRNRKRFTYLLDYVGLDGKRNRVSLGHDDLYQAEEQRRQKERQLRTGIMSPEPMKLSEFLEDSLARTGKQIRESTRREHERAMKDFIEVVGDVELETVTFDQGDLFRQTCLDKGSSPATASKKLRHLKRLFELAVERRQLGENPIRKVKLPKSPHRKVRIYTADECERIIRAARDCRTETSVPWDLLILAAWTTGMRRGELFNTTWADIDFDEETIEVCPKKDTAETWEWHIKDNDCRTLPLLEPLVNPLTEHQGRQPEGYPYVFVPPCRYDRIQQLRRRRRWTLCSTRQNLVLNFTRQFRKILKRAAVKEGTFHDLRRTALSDWLADEDMSEYDVMRLAGHSSFSTTHKFYLAMPAGLIDRARQASTRKSARIWRAPAVSGQNYNKERI